MLALALIAGVGALVRLRSHSPAGAPAGVVIRFAHTNLQPGAREAYDQLIQRYQTLHPGVRVEQITLPIAIYASWLQTQLVGGTAPDLIEIRHGQRNEFVARFFRPLTAWVQEPNPYNEGTPLAGIRWRNTFIDGLQNDPNYFSGLLDYYAIPGTLRTYRLVANLDLLEQITGRRDLPRTQEEWLTLCAQAQAWRDPRGERILPIAAGGWGGFQLLDRAFRRQTQELEARLDEVGQLSLKDEDVAVATLRGQWALRSPAVTAGLDEIARLGRFLPAGFWSIPVGDVHFQFLQGRALFIVAGSQEMTTLHASANFPLQVMRPPDAAAQAPVADGAPLRPDPMAEGNVPTMASIGLTRQSRHPEQALDFLRFISSYEGNRAFSETSGWMPAVLDVPVPEDMVPFAPVLAGSLPGFSLWLVNADVHRQLFVNLHHLVSPNGSATAFQNVIEPFYHRQLDLALRAQMRVKREASARLDGPLAAGMVQALLTEHRVAPSPAAEPSATHRRQLIDETQVGEEMRYLHFDNPAGSPLPPTAP
jgi:raffinose/stachyose/melibiose transport system substrate-binding protein